jgi:hypothetical protein
LEYSAEPDTVDHDRAAMFNGMPLEPRDIRTELGGEIWNAPRYKHAVNDQVPTPVTPDQNMKTVVVKKVCPRKTGKVKQSSSLRDNRISESDYTGLSVMDEPDTRVQLHNVNNSYSDEGNRYGQSSSVTSSSSYKEKNSAPHVANVMGSSEGYTSVLSDASTTPWGQTMNSYWKMCAVLADSDSDSEDATLDTTDTI